VTTQKNVVTTQKGIIQRYYSIARLDTYSMWYNQHHVFTIVHVFPIYTFCDLVVWFYF
jgi:hypothetical protein